MKKLISVSMSFGKMVRHYRNMEIFLRISKVLVDNDESLGGKLYEAHLRKVVVKGENIGDGLIFHDHIG